MKINENRWKSMKINEIPMTFTEFGVNQARRAGVPAVPDTPTVGNSRLNHVPATVIQFVNALNNSQGV